MSTFGADADMDGGALQILMRLAVALAIGLLVGLERGWHTREAQEGGRVAGIRTFGVVSVIGATTSLLTTSLGPWIVVAPLFGLGALITAAYWRTTRSGADFGITTATALLLTFALGGLTGLGELIIAASTAVVLALVLGAKPELHRFVRHLRREELFATLRLLLISIVILPVLPDAHYGPWDAINPYELWWLVVLIGGISYVGYVAIRVIGPRRGIVASALLGGLVSSTAVALSFSRLARSHPEHSEILSISAGASAAVMFPRMLVVAALLTPMLAADLLAPLLAAGAAGMVVAAGLGWRAMRRSLANPALSHESTLGPGNPLDLKMALQFGVLLALILILARGLQAALGEAGLLALAGASGIADVDAILVSVATMANDEAVSADIAVLAVLVAALTNTVAKPALATAIAGPRFGLRMAAPLVAALAVAAVAFVLVTR